MTTRNYREMDEFVAEMKARQTVHKKVVTPDEVYEKAIQKYGAIHQEIKAVEELSELMKEICKALDLELDRSHMAEEMADVSIMLDQLMKIFNNEMEVYAWRAKKLHRLWNRVEGKE